MLVDSYRKKCKELGVKCNSHLIAQLPDQADELDNLDLSSNVVGPRGLAAVLEVAVLSVNLTRLNLSGNNLNSACVKGMCTVCVLHPSLRSINVSNNDIRLAGPDLVELLKLNTRISALEIENTFLRPLFITLISAQLQRNATQRPPIPAAKPHQPNAAAAKLPPIPAANYYYYYGKGYLLREKFDLGEVEKLPTLPPAAKPHQPSAAAAKLPPISAAKPQSTPVDPRLVAKVSVTGSPTPSSAKNADLKFAEDQKAQEGPQEKADLKFAENKKAQKTNEEPEEEFGTFGNFGAFNFEVTEGAADGKTQHHVKITDKIEIMASASESVEGVMLKKTATRRPTVSAEVYTEDEVANFKPIVIPKNEAIRTKLCKILEPNNLFSHLEEFELYVAIDQMAEVKRSAGDEIYDEGDEDGDTFYVLLEGTVSLRKRGTETARVQSGGTFSDVMMLYAQTYDHGATCVSDCTIYSLVRPAYKFILTQSSKKKRAKYEGFLSSIGFLKHLQKQELLQLADALKSFHFEPGSTMITYGTPGEHFYIILEGTVDVLGRDVNTKEPKWVCDFHEGDCVGELEFLNNHPCVADVKAQTFVRVAMMNRHHFELVMGPVKGVLSRIANESNVYEYYRASLAAMQITECGVKERNASLHRTTPVAYSEPATRAQLKNSLEAMATLRGSIRVLQEIGSPSDEDLQRVEEEKDTLSAKKGAFVETLALIPDRLVVEGEFQEAILDMVRTLLEESDTAQHNVSILRGVLGKLDLDLEALLNDPGTLISVCGDGNVNYLEVILASYAHLRLEDAEIIPAACFSQSCRIPLVSTLLRHSECLHLAQEDVQDVVADVLQTFFNEIGSKKKMIPKEVTEGRLELMEALLRHPEIKIDAGAEGDDGLTPLSRAARDGDIPLMEMLLKIRPEINIDHIHSDGTTALIQAVMAKQADFVEAFMSSCPHVDVSIVAPKAGTAFDIASVVMHTKVKVLHLIKPTKQPTKTTNKKAQPEGKKPNKSKK